MEFQDSPEEALLMLRRPTRAALDSGPKHSPSWTLAEDMLMCKRIVAAGGLSEPRLSPSWFARHFDPMPTELAHRNIGALLLRFKYLRDDLLANQDGSWEWLREKHEHSPIQDMYTFEQDLAICQLVLERGLAGKRLGQKFFRQHVVGTVAILDGRNESGLYARYSKRLRKNLTLAAQRNPSAPSFEWLREMHPDETQNGKRLRVEDYHL